MVNGAGRLRLPEMQATDLPLPLNWSRNLLVTRFDTILGLRDLRAAQVFKTYDKATRLGDVIYPKSLIGLVQHHFPCISENTDVYS